MKGQRAGERRFGWRKLKKRLRHGYVRLVRSPGAPSEIAGGMALGLFLAMLPILQAPVAVGLAEGLRRAFRVRLSKLAALAGIFLTNPVTGPVIYGGAFFVGRPFARMLLPEDRLAQTGALQFSLTDLTQAGPFALELVTSLAIGGALLGVPIAIGGFFVTRAVVRRYQQRRARRGRVESPASVVRAA